MNAMNYLIKRARFLAHCRRKKTVENPGPTEAKEERGSQILWRLWLERRQGRKRNRRKSEHDEDQTLCPSQATGTSLDGGLSLNQAKDTRGLDSGVSQPRNGTTSSLNHSDGYVKSRSMQSSTEDSFPSDEAVNSHLDDEDDVFERLSVPKLSRYPGQMNVLVATTNNS